MKYNIHTALFDLDGVVAFTDRYHYLGWKKLSDEMGWEFNESINNKLRGVPRMTSLRIILDHNKIDLPTDEMETLAARKNQYYVELLNNIHEDDLFPGSVPFIKKLRGKGVKTGLCSSSKNALFVLKKLGLIHLFDTVVTGNDIQKSKPDPEIFQLAARRLGSHSLNCIVFEDAESGVEAALAAGMKCVGVGARENLQKAQETIKNYDEIDIEEFLVTGRKKKYAVLPWSMIETEINPKRAAFWESMFALCNGYMGLRGTYDSEDERIKPYSSPGMCINSIYDYSKYYSYVCNFPGLAERYHSMLNLNSWAVINLTVVDEPFSYFTGALSNFRREFDMKNGVLHCSFTWESPKGRQVTVRSTRLVSMVRRHSAALKYEVTPMNFSGRIILESVTHDPHNGEYSSNPIEKLESGVEDTLHHFLYRTKTEGFKIGIVFGHTLSKAPETSAASTMNDTLIHKVSVALSSGETLSMIKNTSFYTSFDQNKECDLIEKAAGTIRQDMSDGFERLLQEQSDFWERYWETADIEIKGNDADQQMMRFNLFQLRQNHPEDDRMSISATGVTGNNYGGLVFWDTEIYMNPYFIYTQPELVRSLLMYRYFILDHARRRAKEVEGVGALFSWMSISGEETNALPECSTAQIHINCDVAYVIKQYFLATGDVGFMYNYGAEILFETARYYAERGKYIAAKGNKFCFNCVCGPDEYGCSVNNNTYTNLMVQIHFNFATDIYRRMKKESPMLLERLAEKIGLKEEESASWKKAAENMYINYNEELGVYAQDDLYLYKDPVDMSKLPRNFDIRYSYYPINLWRMQITKQADLVLALFLAGDQFSLEEKRANYAFYEPRTCHGSSLSPCIHSIIASEIGLHEDAYDFFHQSLYMDNNDFRGNTKGGIHFACAGGTWMAMVNGFAGMRDYDDEFILNPHLPDQWASYRFKMVYRGRLLEITVTKEKASVRLISGDALSLTFSGKKATLFQPGEKITVEIK